jgi:hypothetical protein
LSEQLRHLNRFQVVLLVITLGQSWGLAVGLSTMAAPRHGTAAPLTAGIMTWLWLTAIIAAGFKPELRDKRTYPNEGIRRSARNGLRVGLAVTVATCLGGVSRFGGQAGPRIPTLRLQHRKTVQAGPEPLSTVSLPIR